MAAPRAFGSQSPGPSSDLRQRVRRRVRAVFASGSHSPGPSSDRRQHMPRRAPVAFAFGAVIAAAGLAALSSGLRGRARAFLRRQPYHFRRRPAHARRLFPGRGGARQGGASATQTPAHHRHRRRLPRESAAHSGRGAVCVRLCDGAFFPLDAAAGDAAAEAAACDRLCPDAPTEVFFRNGSDKIGDAISTAGRRYSALPVALRYQRSPEATCACHREPCRLLRRCATRRFGAAMRS